jgi:hypothetical protein
MISPVLEYAGDHSLELGWVLGVGALCVLGGIIGCLFPPPSRRRCGNRRRHRLGRRLEQSGQLRRML